MDFIALVKHRTQAFLPYPWWGEGDKKVPLPVFPCNFYNHNFSFNPYATVV